MADAGNDERGIADRGTSTEPFRLAREEPVTSEPAPAPTTPTRSGVTRGRPKLTKDFEAKFQAFKAEYLKTVSYDERVPFKRNFWKPVLELTGQQAIDEGTAEANRWLDRVIRKLTAPDVDDCTRDALVTFFHVENANELNFVIPTVTRALTDVRDGDLGINSSDVLYDFGGWRCGGGDYGYTGKVVKTETMLCHPTWNDTFSDYPNVEMLARTLIHESLHRLNTWPVWSDYGLGTDEMSQSAALRNPDSYAVFALEAGKCPDL